MLPAPGFDDATHARIFAQCEAVTMAFGGQAAVDELHELAAIQGDGPWRVRSVGGYGSRYCKDIRVAPVNDTFSVVYWSWEGAAISPLWSFHISRRRPEAVLGVKHAFDERIDAPVNLAAEHLRALIYSDDEPEPAVLREGLLFAPEESLVWLEHSPVGGATKFIPIRFPLLQPKPDFGAVVLT